MNRPGTASRWYEPRHADHRCRRNGRRRRLFTQRGVLRRDASSPAPYPIASEPRRLEGAPRAWKGLDRASLNRGGLVMKRNVVVAALALAASAVAATAAGDELFKARLSGDQEAPPGGPVLTDTT